jgi:hypothetical protein
VGGLGLRGHAPADPGRDGRALLDFWPLSVAGGARPAPVEDVLAAWSGLGYYRRARQLAAAVRTLAAAGGELPRTAGELARLPGIGPYTAAAIASIAFGEAVPALDGNVARVLSRRLAASGPVRPAARRRLLAAAARPSTPRGRRLGPGPDGLGARICTPRAASAPVRSPPAAPAAPQVRRALPARGAAGARAGGGGRVGGRRLLVRRAGRAQMPGHVGLPPSPSPTAARPSVRSAAAGSVWRLGAVRCASATGDPPAHRAGCARRQWRAESVAEPPAPAGSRPSKRQRCATSATRKLLARLGAPS